MVRWNKVFLIIGGDTNDRFESGAEASRIFSWKLGTDPKDITVNPGDLNPKAIVVFGQGNQARILISQRRRELSRSLE